MIREEVRFLGCGFNKAKYAGHMKYCIEHGLDFGIYKLGCLSQKLDSEYFERGNHVTWMTNFKYLA